jgi:hypothetical protein
MRRFVDGSIQATKRGARPLYANHPIGSLFYNLQGYIHGFTQEVLLRSAKMGKRGITEKGLTAADRMRLLAPSVMLGTIFAASQAALMEAKNLIYYNPDQKDQTNLDNLFKYMDLAGFAGNYSMLINAVRGIGYGRSVDQSLQGPLISTYSKAATDMAKAAFYNSPNSNTQERNAMKSVYSDFVQPALINLVVTRVPNPLVAFVATQAIAHPATKAAAVDITAGKSNR